jgi:hypothetical protein
MDALCTGASLRYCPKEPAVLSPPE